MNSDCVAMLNDPSVKQRYEPLGIVAAGSSAEQLAAMNVSDVTHWAPIIKAANIKGE
jgi:tripartite-type tricarboxylate transporter receptor subunit TctC